MMSNGQLGVKELHIEVQKLREAFHLSQEHYDQLQLFQKRNQELEMELMRLKIDRDNSIQEAKMKIEEQFDEELDKIKHTTIN